jgi:hypothetical protein
MTSKDTALIAAAFAEAERMNESLGVDKDGMTASTLRLLAADIAGRIKAEHPRFNVGAFEVACFPRQHERQRQAIAKRLDQPFQVGDRVESSRWGAGQPRIVGTVAHVGGHDEIVVKLDNGIERKRSARNLRKVADA